MSLLAAIERLIPKPRVAGGTIRPRTVERVIVFGRLPSPTYDFYLARRLEGPEGPPTELVDLSKPGLPQSNPEGAFVIFCRYADRKSLDWVESHADRLAGVGLFIDDDLAAWITSPGVPLHHRLYVLRHGIWPLVRLNRHLDRLWTSTPVLARAIGDANAIVLPLSPRPADFASGERRSKNGQIQIVYQAEYHADEHRFLLPVMAEVLRQCPRVQFEVTYSKQFARQWAALPRVTIAPFRPWPEYRAHTAANPVDIALVPLLPTRINRARASTKRIDVARMRAVALFSRASIFEADAGAGEIFLPNNREVWIDTIMRLAVDPAAQAAAAAATRNVVERLAGGAAEFPGLPGFIAADD
jgi:hypothetical protein